ncbi:MAG: GTPase [Dehalococcoidia bacterium]|nr:GTPase [Dehalococcoidia bacterium]
MSGTAGPAPVRTVILGAAGRDFHNFNTVYRDDPGTRVVAFTATQIPGIAGRRYPAALAGPHYPDGIPIVPEDELEALCAREVQRVVFAYSDVTHETVMHLASRALAAGADFELLGPDRTMLRSRKPVIAVSATRTGSGKSQVARWLASFLRERRLRVAVVRHPMPYGDLAAQAVQRFAAVEDLRAAGCTVEEREEYEPHIARGAVVYAGVDYAAILARAEAEADVVVWDGGNNDFPFFRPDLHIVAVDALRPGQVATYHPGEAVLRMADVVVLNKVDSAGEGGAAAVETEVRAVNHAAPIVRAASPVRLDDPGAVAGRRVLVVEDGPTITHGGMAYGAGFVAATAGGASEVVDPRASAAPAIAAVFAQYPHIGRVLPAAGYDAGQLAALAATINASGADVVVSATPADLAALVRIDLPVVRARYEYADAGEPRLATFVESFLRHRGPPRE